MPYRDYYREKLLEEIETVPKEMTPVLYKVVHLLNTELSSKGRKGKRGSLKGIWKGSVIDDNLFTEARKSVFSYEDK